MAPAPIIRRTLHKAKRPHDFGAAVLRRILPTSARYGFPWVHLPDGSITFHERGFVAADSPSSLLARHNYESRRIRSELAGATFDRSLEVGCGFGRLSFVFSEFSNQHIAVDINPAALSLAREAYPDLLFQQTDQGRLPFPDDHFGLVCSWTVVQHVPPDRIERMCAEIKRVLEPGGTLLLCEETRNPGVNSNFSWHRSVDQYIDLFAPLSLERHAYITEIDRIPGMESPGEVMTFRHPLNRS